MSIISKNKIIVRKDYNAFFFLLIKVNLEVDRLYIVDGEVLAIKRKNF